MDGTQCSETCETSCMIIQGSDTSNWLLNKTFTLPSSCVHSCSPDGSFTLILIPLYLKPPYIALQELYARHRIGCETGKTNTGVISQGIL